MDASQDSAVDDGNFSGHEQSGVASMQRAFYVPPERVAAARKRSLHLTLVLVSAAALTACGGLEGDRNMSRDAYANLEACKADWGAAGDCEAVKPGTDSSTHGFYGPRYYSRSGTSGSSGSSGFSSAARPGSNAMGTVSGSASRGGFGASSARHSGGSSGSAHSSGG